MNNVKPYSTESPNKRRLSPRRENEDPSALAADKRPRIVLERVSPGASQRTLDYASDAEGPDTATSSRFPHHQSVSSQSTPPSSPGRLRRASYPPRWVTDDDRNRRSTENSGSSSRSSARTHSQRGMPMPSVGASRQTSPPAPFGLPGGQALIMPSQKTQAAFVGKLYSMLEDDEIIKTGLIYWSAGGTTFTCPNPTEFSKVVLPRYFKHNNWQSFVRQLNMYSFNKVNDIYATSNDPQAWEFRHNLFRRGEPQLLASIKRKSSRPSAHDGGPTSPVDELQDTPKAVAGWMRDQGANPLQPHSPTYQPRNVAAPGYPLPGHFEEPRPGSRTGFWESRQPGPPVINAGSRIPPTEPPRLPPDQSRVPPPVRGYHPSPFPESVYPYPGTMPPSIESLSEQVVFLEQRLHRLAETLNIERIDHVRDNIDFTSYLLQMVGWASSEQPSPEMKALHDTLSRQNTDMRQKYEDLMASDALGFTRGLGGGERDRPRERGPTGEVRLQRGSDEARARMLFEPPMAAISRPLSGVSQEIRPPLMHRLSRGSASRDSPVPRSREFGDLAIPPRLSPGPLRRTGSELALFGGASPSSSNQLPPMNVARAIQSGSSLLPIAPDRLEGGEADRPSIGTRGVSYREERKLDEAKNRGGLHNLLN
ncbi:hypothetical protein IAU60_004790 [Kwoniella sp. DSM 27419]